MPDKSTETPSDLTAPIMPTGSGPVDLEIAHEEDVLAEGRITNANDAYWDKQAELHRKHADEAGPDVPLRLPTTKVSDGKLGDIIDQWSAFSDDDRPRYVIHLGGGSLAYSTMESFRTHPRDQAV